MKRRHAALALMIAGALAAPGCALIFGIEEVTEGTGGTVHHDGGPDVLTADAHDADTVDAADAADANDDAADASNDVTDASDDVTDASDAADASDDVTDASDAADASDGSVPGPCEWPITQDWTRTFAGTDVSVASVALDSQGRIIVAGTVAGDLDIDGQMLPGGADRDVFVLALDAHGQPLWSRRFGDTGDQRALALATDPPLSPSPDAVVITGSFTGTLDFHGSAAPLVSNYQRAFVARLDPVTGDGVAAVAAGDDPAKAHAGTALASVPDGTLFWAGTEDNAATLFLRRLDTSLAVTAATQPVCSGCDPRVARIPGGVAIAGGFSGQLDLVAGGIGQLMSAGGADAFVGALSVSGSAFHEDLVTGVGDAAAQKATGIVADNTGSVFIAGDFEGGINWKGGVSISSTGSLDAFVTKLDSQLKGLWAARFGSANPALDQRAAAIAVGSHVAVAGDFLGAVDTGVGAPLVSAGSLDGYAVALDPSTGTPKAAFPFGSSALDRATAVAADQSSHIFVGGVLGAPATLACGTVGASGKSVFVARRTVP